MKKILNMILTVMQWLATSFFLMFTIYYFFGKKNLICGFVFLLLAFFVSPMFDKIIKKEVSFRRVLLKFLASFVSMCVIFALFIPHNNNSDNLVVDSTLSEDESISYAEDTVALTTTTQSPASITTETTTTKPTTTIATTEPVSTTEKTTAVQTTTTTTKKSTTNTTTSNTITTFTTSKATTTAAEITTTATETTTSSVKIVHFILNSDTYCVHCKKNCRAAKEILPENYMEIDIREDELYLYNNQYWACGICAGQYKDVLPKF